MTALLFAAFGSCTEGDKAGRGTAYSFETVVRCGAAGDFRRFARSGWAGSDSAFRWTGKKQAKLKVSLPPVRGPIALRMRLMANIDPPDLTVQPVEVSANGHQVTVWLVPSAEDYHVIIPTEIPRPNGKLYLPSECRSLCGSEHRRLMSSGLSESPVQIRAVNGSKTPLQSNDIPNAIGGRINREFRRVWPWSGGIDRLRTTALHEP